MGDVVEDVRTVFVEKNDTTVKIPVLRIKNFVVLRRRYNQINGIRNLTRYEY